MKPENEGWGQVTTYGSWTPSNFGSPDEEVSVREGPSLLQTIGGGWFIMALALMSSCAIPH